MIEICAGACTACLLKLINSQTLQESKKSYGVLCAVTVQLCSNRPVIFSMVIL
jgi:hypothetical protein